MKIFGYEILDSHTNEGLLNNKQYFLVEEEISSAKSTYELKLYNNQYREVKITSDKSFDNIQKNQSISFIVKDVVSFTYRIGSFEIYFTKLKDIKKNLITYWLYHTFFPILLTFENRYYFLHAGAVEIEKKPILFVASSFGGKSTLTDFFLKKGHIMISDDKVATYEEDNRIYSVPSYAYHRPYRKMEDLGEVVENFAKDNKPIDTIFNLVKVDSNSDITINKISGAEKFDVLRQSTDIKLPIHKEKRFKYLANIANKVDVYNITIPWDLNRLAEVYQTIIDFTKNKKA